MLKKILLSFLVIFGLTFLLSSNSYADTLCSYQYDSSHLPGIDQQLCTDHINDVRYVEVIYNSSVTGDTGGIKAQFTIGYQNYNMNNWYGRDYYLIGITESPYGFAVSSFNASFSENPDWILTVNLHDSFPATGITPSGTLDISSNGTYDVTNYASAVINIPTEEIIEDPISNDFQKVFFAIVKNIIPAFGILIVVWFGIDMLSSLIFGRGR